jgi:glycosyltransferase involved in cell wall biosynthesis
MMTGEMRLAFVTELYAPSVGGQETRFRSLAEALVGAGHEVEVLCIGHRRDLAPIEVIGGVTVRRHPLVDGYHDSRFGPMSSVVRLATVRLPFAWWTRRTLTSGGFDAILYNQYPIVHVLLAPRAARRRAAVDWCEVREGMVHGLSRRILPRMVAANLCVNEAAAAAVQADSGRPVTYLPSGVWADAYGCRPRAERRGVLYLGRLFDNKDLPLLVRGWHRYRQRGGTEPLVVAGDGPARAQLEEAVAALPGSMRGEVSLLGAVDELRKVELLASSALLAITSNREGFPNVVAEATAARLPVATVDAPRNGTASVVRRYEIGAVGSPDPDGVADAIDQTLARWAEFSAAAGRAATTLGWPQLADELLAVLGAVSRSSSPR